MRKPHIIDNGHTLEQMKLLKNKSGNIIAQPCPIILRQGVDIINHNHKLSLVGVVFIEKESCLYFILFF